MEEPSHHQQGVGYPREPLKLHIPAWVKLTIWGSPNRTWVLGFGWSCVVLAALCFIAGFLAWPFFLLGPVGLAGMPYFLAAGWMDKHGAWEQRSKESIWKL